MALFTCLFDYGESTCVRQVEAQTPEEALRAAVQLLPLDDGEGPDEEELAFLEGAGSGGGEVTMLAVGGCANTWMWLEGTSFEPPYVAYIVRTAEGEDR